MTRSDNDHPTVKAAKINYKGTIITVLISSVVLIMLTLFKCNNSNETEDNEVANVIASYDSSTQVIVPGDQDNSNNGNVYNEYVGGDKIVNQNSSQSSIPKSIPKPTKPPKEPPISIERIENSGNLSIGQSGGIVNQNVYTEKPSPLILTDKFKQDLKLAVDNALQKLPIESNNCIEVEGVMGNTRSIKFSEMIGDFLELQGYNVRGQRVSMIVDAPEGKSIGIGYLEGCVVVTVYDTN